MSRSLRKRAINRPLSDEKPPSVLCEPDGNRLWPYRPKPFPDESLSSWIARTAIGNGRRLHSFCHQIWPKRQIWNRDVDSFSDAALIRTMAEKTATPIDVAQRTSVGSLTSWLFEKHNTSGPTRWLLRAGVYHRTRRSFGQQYCPRCLAEGEAYYRLSWRFAWVTACERHRLVLLDRCPKCRQPVMFHRPAMKLESIVYCGTCQLDLRKADASWEVVDTIALKFQAQNAKILEQGWTELGIYPIHYSFAYFDIVHQLARILSSGMRSEALRTYVSRKWGGDPSPVVATKARAEFELLGPASRHRTLGLTARLIQKWPSRFIEACQASNVWNSWALKDETRPSYPLWHPIRHHAYKPLYTPSHKEIRSTRQHLIRIGQNSSPSAPRLLLGVDGTKFLISKTHGRLAKLHQFVTRKPTL